VRALAVKALKEKATVIAMRQIVRAVAKGVTVTTAKNNLGELGGLAANIWNIVSESADLRSWLTLPANAQILRATLPSGRQKLELQHPMVPGITSVDVDIPMDGKAVVLATRTGRQLYFSVTSIPR
jgi:hypothetical protein